MHATEYTVKNEQLVFIHLYLRYINYVPYEQQYRDYVPLRGSPVVERSLL
jgi:hypothetical protein